MKQFRKFLPPDLEQKLTELKVFQVTLDTVLPPEYRRWVRLGGLSHNTLTLVVTRQAIAGNLRFHGENIMNAMRKNHGLDIRKIQVRVIPEQYDSPHQQRNKEKPRTTPNPIISSNRQRLRKLLRRL